MSNENSQDEAVNAQLLIEQDERGGVTITTNQDELSVEKALLLLELARMNILSFYLGGQTTAQSLDESA